MADTDSPLPDDAGLQPIESIVVRRSRPAILVSHGTFSPPEGPWSVLSESRELIERALRSVCLINLVGPPSSPTVGTAFLVGKNLLITTRRVAAAFCEGVGRTGLRLSPGVLARADFIADGSDQAGAQQTIMAVELIHPVLDIALLRLEDGDRFPLELSPEQLPHPEERRVITLGAVSFDVATDPADDATLASRIFGASGPRKRILPGRLLAPEVISSYGTRVWTLTHDCTTTAVTAGAPIIDLATTRVVAMHLSGGFLERNYAIPTADIVRDARVVDVGLPAGGAVDPSPTAWSAEWEAADPPSDAETKAPRPRAHSRDGSADVDRFERLVQQQFAAVGDFVRLLQSLGDAYASVVNAVPERGSEVRYRRELIQSLQRRRLLDDTLEAAVTHHSKRVTIETVSASPAPSVELPADPVAGTQRDGHGSLSPETLAQVIAAAQKVTIDFSAFTYGSIWHEQLVRPDQQSESLSNTIGRLAASTNDRDRRALTWLLRKLYQTVNPPQADILEPIAKALHELTGAEVERGIGLEQLLPNVPVSVDITYLARGAEAARAVGIIQSQDDEGHAKNGSTCWLLTPSLVVAPAHVLQPPGAPPVVLEPVSGVTATFESDRPGEDDKTVQVTRIEMLDLALDLAVLRLADALADRKPLRIDPRSVAPELLAAIHHPRLGPKRLSISDGKVLDRDGNQMTYLLATEPGSAGAPVFDERWHVVATHRAWQWFPVLTLAEPIKAKVGTTITALIDRLRANRTGIWDEVVSAQPALKVIDPAIESAFFECRSRGEPARVPVVIQVVDDTGTFQDVSGLSRVTRAGRFLTGHVEPEAVEQLRRRPDVLGIQLSRVAGTFECGVSVPHIGAIAVHGRWSEQGDQALIGVIDAGVDIFHKAFQTADGRSRVVAFWDQKYRQEASREEGVFTVSDAARALADRCELHYGALYVQSDLQKFLDGAREGMPSTFTDADTMDHGTAVCSVLAGRRTGDGEGDFPGGVAPQAQLIVVRYDLRGQSVGYADSHIHALKLIDHVAAALDRPVVVNISNGMNAGAHDGTSDVETACNDFTGAGQKPGRVIVKSAGNENGSGRHARVKVSQGRDAELLWRTVRQQGAIDSVPDTIELWFHAHNEYVFRVRTPDRHWTPDIKPSRTAFEEYLVNGNFLLARYDKYNGQNGDASLHLRITAGRRPTIEDGDWRLEIRAVRVVNSEPIEAWIEETPDRVVTFQSHLEEEVSLTIPGTAEHVITVGAVAVGERMRVYDKSSSGPTRKRAEKPDLVAPGVQVRTARSSCGGGFDPVADARSGTSLAAPHVTGVIALALSARAKTNNAVQLNAKQVRAALIRTTKHFSQWDEITGWGEIDAEAFFAEVELI